MNRFLSTEAWRHRDRRDVEHDRGFGGHRLCIGSERLSWSRVVDMVSKAGGRTHAAILADKVAGVFVLAVIGIALATFIIWGLFGPDPAWGHAAGQRGCRC